jgi:uncharacterized membrane protein YjfL (UPF0719 family)
MLELVAQVLAYSGVGLVVLVAGFFVIDALTPGRLGVLVMDGNPNAAVLAATAFVVLDLLTPGKLGVVCEEPRLHPATLVSAAVQLATALVVCASLT